ncbi:AAA family ATPase [Sulfuricaulis sp.]|jgi:chromosome partitioning protein|uniref:nucleotide-binding protein n=1 Tax=Sulfuricaulis sp. TaxID=2003553 RepID=UPI003559791A
MRKIMLLNAKGGCGKSTLATNLASYYAAQGKSVVIADFDRQGSSMEWLEARPQDRPPIRGIAAWREPLRVPRSTDYVIMDVPAGAHGPDLTALVRRAQTVIIPVLPSPTDIRAAAHFIHEALLVGKIVRNETRLAVVANRVHENTSIQNTMESVLNRMSISYSTLNTQIYHNLERFLSRLRIPFIATLRESQNYLVADARGLGIFDLHRSQVTRDTEQWEPLLKWLESKRSIPEPAT